LILSRGLFIHTNYILKLNLIPIIFALFVIVSVFSSENLSAQIDNQEIEMEAEVMPEYPGGFGALAKYLQRNLKYPDIAIEHNIQGKVYVKFVVRKDGSIEHIEVVKGIGGGCDQEAVRVIKNSPKWSPGMHDGEPVNVWFTVPINFQLHGKDKKPKENRRSKK